MAIPASTSKMWTRVETITSASGAIQLDARVVAATGGLLVRSITQNKDGGFTSSLVYVPAGVLTVAADGTVTID